LQNSNEAFKLDDKEEKKFTVANCYLHSRAEPGDSEDVMEYEIRRFKEIRRAEFLSEQCQCAA